MKNKKEKGFIAEIILVICCVFLLIVIVAVGYDFYLTAKHSIGWVWQDRQGTAMKEFIKEEDNCVYFIDTWGNENKVCGVYQIKNYNR